MRTPNGIRIANVWDSEEAADPVWPCIQKLSAPRAGNPGAMRVEQYDVIHLIVP